MEFQMAILFRDKSALSTDRMNEFL